MGERTFEFRLRSSHPAPDRASEGLVVEFLTEAGAWETQQLSLTMSGFRLDASASEQERMKLCPISRNLPEWVGKRIEISSLG